VCRDLPEPRNDPLEICSISPTPRHAFELAAQMRRALVGRRMGREERRDRTSIATLLASQDFHELEHPVRIPPGAPHDLDANPIRFAFVVATELQQVTAGEDLRTQLSGARPAAVVPQHGAEQADQAVRDEPVRDLLGGVASCNVRDLVRKDACELRLVPRRLDGAAIDPHRPAGQGEGIDLAVIRDREAVGILRPACVRDKAPPDACDVLHNSSILEDWHVPLDLMLRLTPQRDLVLNRDQ